MTQRAPLIVVLGATACGKSKLAIELAKRFHGEIISADSMQVYKGLDIVTNKVSEEEQQQVKHHLIDFVDPKNRYSIVDFRDRSLTVINRLHQENKVPIVVGGTNYYIESILWKSFLIGSSNTDSGDKDSPRGKRKQSETLIDAEARDIGHMAQENLHSDKDLDDVELFFSKPIFNDHVMKLDGGKLWSILEKVDPEAAHLYHPKNKRRVVRSLQIYQRNKQSYSSLLKTMNKSQGEEEEKSSLGGPLRYNPTCVIWLSCDSQVLDKVLDERVDKMLDQGLLAELEHFHEDYNKERLSLNRDPEYDKGIFQTIGFKEFHDYLMLDPATKTSEEGNRMLKRAIDDMKLSTRKYARRQIKWIRRRFMQKGVRDLPLVFRLNVEFDESNWNHKVRSPSFEIIGSVLEGREFDEASLAHKQEPEKQEMRNDPGFYNCKLCDKILIGSYYIDAHLSSRAHKRRVSSVRKDATKPTEHETGAGDTIATTTEHNSPDSNDTSLRETH